MLNESCMPYVGNYISLDTDWKSHYRPNSRSSIAVANHRLLLALRDQTTLFENIWERRKL